MEVVVTDSIRDAIIALQNGESGQFKAAISDSMMNKAMGAINVEKISAGQKFFDQPEEDSYDSEQEDMRDEEI
tara:strand:- start:279 stop:497 length:219 start_codon:yes stop_codon:yes gene_type:complete